MVVNSEEYNIIIMKYYYNFASQSLICVALSTHKEMTILLPGIMSVCYHNTACQIGQLSANSRLFDVLSKANSNALMTQYSALYTV